MVARPETGSIPDAPGLVPVHGRRRPGDLRRQGQEPAQPAVELLRRSRDLLPERTRQMVQAAERVEWIEVAQRGRGALPRVQPHQAAPAALQHPAEGRQVVPVPRGHARRGVAAGDGDARQEAQGRPLLRSVRARVRDPRDARPAAAHVPDPHVHEEQVRPAPPARPAVPLRAHREVRGAVRRRRSTTRSTTSSSHELLDFLDGEHDAGARAARASACTRRPTQLEFERAARLRDQLAQRAQGDRAPADGRRQARRTSTSSASPRTSSRRRCRCSTCARAGSSGRKGLDRRQGRGRRRRPRSSPGSLEQLYGDAEPRRRPARRSSSRSLPEDLDLYEEFLALNRGSQGARSACRSAARSASCSQTVDAQRAGGVRAPQAQARVRPQRPGPGAARAAGGARAARSAAAHRVLRHLEPAGHRDRRVDGRDGGRLAEALRLPALQDRRPSTARTTSRRWRRC